MGKVILDPLVKEKLVALVEVLFEEEYFGFLDSAIAYVSKLENFVLSIPEQKKRPCKSNQFGNWHCKFKSNKSTTWYFTFDTDGRYYLVRNVFNNHTKDYTLYI